MYIAVIYLRPISTDCCAWEMRFQALLSLPVPRISMFKLVSMLAASPKSLFGAGPNCLRSCSDSSSNRQTDNSSRKQSADRCYNIYKHHTAYIFPFKISSICTLYFNMILQHRTATSTVPSSADAVTATPVCNHIVRVLPATTEPFQRYNNHEL